MKSRITKFVILACGLLPGMLGAATYYVAPSSVGGNNANPGSLSQPWQTIDKAAATLAAGDTVLIRSGTYNFTQGIKPANSGTSGNPITFKAFPGEVVTLNGGAGSCFDLGQRSYITFEGVRMTTSSTVVGASMIYMEDSHNCSFLSCEFFGMPAPNGRENTSIIRCMLGSSFARNAVIRNCYFRDNNSPCMHLYNTDGWVIENNEFRNGTEFIGGKQNPRNMTIRRNLFVNCSGNAVLYFPGQYGSANVTITENIGYNCEAPVYILGGLSAQGNQRTNTRFFNNTFYECRNFIQGWDDGTTTNNSYYNNIVYSVTARNIPSGDDFSSRFLNINRWGGTPISPSNFYFDYNCLQIPSNDSSMWFNDGNNAFYSLAQWKTARAPFEANSISANPLFVNPAAGNFHLQAGSPCLGTGRNGENIGAYPRGNDGTVIGRITADSVAPTVSLTTPATGATVAGTATVSASATDNVGVAGVQFQLDGVNLGTEDTATPFSISWDTTTASNGNHLLTAIARDAVGNTTTSASVTVTVSNAGTEVNVTGKGVGIVDGATVPLAANATDFDGVGTATGSVTNTYTIYNQGGSVLTIGTVTVSGTHAADFSVTAQPATTVAVGGSTTFKVKFAPSALGLRQANLSFSNNDTDENPYNIALQGRGELIVDNLDASGVTFLPSRTAWQSGTSVAGYHGSNYFHDGDTNKGNMSARFTPTLPSTGAYGVFARWTAHQNRAEHVPIDITTAGGVIPIEVNQRNDGGIWVPLGSYLFNSGSTGSVLVSNTGTVGTVIADAVKFVLQVINPGFESSVDGAQTVTGWSESGTNPSASSVSGTYPAHSGSRYLTHFMRSAYSIFTSQTRTDLPTGSYTLKAWVLRSGAQTTAQMEASGFGGATMTVDIPVSATWTQISIQGIYVTNGTCTFGFRSVAPASAFIRVDDVEFYQQ